MTFRHVLWLLARDYAGGARQLALDIGKPGKVFEQKLGLHDNAHVPNIDDAELVLDACPHGNVLAAEYFSNKANGVFVPLPDISNLGDMAMLDAYMQIMRELGDLANEFQLSYADGVISNIEFENIGIHVTNVQSKLLAFRLLVKQVVR